MKKLSHPQSHATVTWTLALALTATFVACKARGPSSSSQVNDAGSRYAYSCSRVQPPGEQDRPFPEPQAGGRPFISDWDVESCISENLKLYSPEEARWMRYLTLTHLYNAGIKEQELLMYRGATSKALNSLSLAKFIVRPVPVDSAGTILRIDLRHYGWDQPLAHYGVDPFEMVFGRSDRTFEGEEDFTPNGHNYKIHPAYPYAMDGINYGGSRPNTFRQDIKRYYGRADWLTTRATIPPLYHAILGLPTNDLDLEEKFLGSRDYVETNIQNGCIARAGFNGSGVSSNNRLLERHEIRGGDYTPESQGTSRNRRGTNRTYNGNGNDSVNCTLETNKAYYWKSYDFAKSAQSSSFLTNPFGPCFRTIDSPQPFANGNQSLFQRCQDLTTDQDFEARKVFKQGGGEIIWTLPNGLQAYFLIKGDGERISVGPAQIVADLSNPDDKFEVINGRSCMFCHYNGMIEGKPDQVGPSIKGMISTFARTPNFQGHPTILRQEADRFLTTLNGAKYYAKDSQTYLENERKAVGPGVPLRSDPPAAMEPFKAVISASARGRYYEVVNFFNDRYENALSAQQVAAEFGLRQEEFTEQVQALGDDDYSLMLKKLLRGNGKTLNREQIEENYQKFRNLLWPRQ